MPNKKSIIFSIHKYLYASYSKVNLKYNNLNFYTVNNILTFTRILYLKYLLYIIAFNHENKKHSILNTIPKVHFWLQNFYSVITLRPGVRIYYAKS